MCCAPFKACHLSIKVEKVEAVSHFSTSVQSAEQLANKHLVFPATLIQLLIVIPRNFSPEFNCLSLNQLQFYHHMFLKCEIGVSVCVCVLVCSSRVSGFISRCLYTQRLFKQLFICQCVCVLCHRANWLLTHLHIVSIMIIVFFSLLLVFWPRGLKWKIADYLIML